MSMIAGRRRLSSPSTINSAANRAAGASSKTVSAASSRTSRAYVHRNKDATSRCLSTPRFNISPIGNLNRRSMRSARKPAALWCLTSKPAKCWRWPICRLTTRTTAASLIQGAPAIARSLICSSRGRHSSLSRSLPRLRPVCISPTASFRLEPGNS